MRWATTDVGPTVSVVIPTYNHARFLPEAIQSALNQRDVDLEIIVVDDGSTDETRALVAGYGDQVRYIWQENVGLSAARNTGIRNARGEYVAFLDADDSWEATFLAGVMTRWSEDAGVGAIHTGFYSIGEDGSRLPQVFTDTVPDESMYDRLLDGEFFVPSAVVARRACFDRVGFFDETLRGSEDWDMWMRVAREYRFAGISEPLVNYRIHGRNMSGNPGYMLRYQQMVVEKHFGSTSGPPDYWPRERQRAFAAVCRYAAQGYYLRRDLASSKRYLRLALEANPSLCESVDFYYELGVADRPLGQRDLRSRGDLEANADFLLSALDEIFGSPDLPGRVRVHKRRAMGRACLALALLAYGTERLEFARGCALKAVVLDPRLLSHPRLVTTIAKTLLGRRLLEVLRRCSLDAQIASRH